MSDTWIEIDLPLGCVRIQTVLGWQVDTLEGCHEVEVGMQSQLSLSGSSPGHLLQEASPGCQLVLTFPSPEVLWLPLARVTPGAGHSTWHVIGPQ